MTKLGQFPIVQRSMGSCFVGVQSYESYTLAGYLPKPQFDERIEKLSAFVRDAYPSSIVEIIFVTASISVVLGVAILSIFSYQMHFTIPYQIFVIIVPFLFGVWHFARKRNETARVGRFEEGLTALLKDFTSLDLATKNIKWSFKKSPGRPYIVNHRTMGTSYWRVEVYQADAETEVDELPEYRPLYDEPAVLAAEPPEYEERGVRTGEVVVEIEMEESNLGGGRLGEIATQLRDSEINREDEAATGGEGGGSVVIPVPTDGPPSYRDLMDESRV